MRAERVLKCTMWAAKAARQGDSSGPGSLGTVRSLRLGDRNVMKRMCKKII
jgi:hypothetical protein